MDNGRNMTAFTGKNNRNGYEASFGEDDIRMKDFHKFFCFAESFDHTERIRKVLKAEIPAELTGRDTMIWNPLLFNQLLFHTVVRTDVMYVILQFPKTGKQCNIRCNMSGSTSAGQNDAFHNKNPPIDGAN